MELPIGTKVELTGLKAEHYNHKTGVVKGSLIDGRQAVFVNVELASLNIREMQAVLAVKGVSASRMSGLDKAGLMSLLEEHISPSDELSVLIAQGPSRGSGALPEEISSRKEKEHSVPQMDPAKLRQQAKALRTMNPNQIRRSNPQMASYTDAQILEAADQMEQMADNPDMMRVAQEQMKHMTPQQLLDMKRNKGKKRGTPNDADLLQQSKQLSNMDPATLKAQAKMIRSMDPGVVRRTQPQMANFSDQQIREAADQMEQMADNPEMLEAMREQMKNMTPEQFEEMKKTMGEGGGGGAGMDMSKMPDAASLNKLDPKMIKTNLKMIKSNPAMLKNAMKMFPGSEKMGEEQFLKQIDMMINMDDDSLKTFLSRIGMVSEYFGEAKKVWDRVDKALHGQLLRLVLLFLAFLVYSLVKWLFFSRARTSPAGGASAPLAAAPEAALAEALLDAATSAAKSAESVVSAGVTAGGQVSDEFDS